jgi:hypothetical protein
VEIESVEYIGRDELLATLRRTRLQGFDGVEPYARAGLDLTMIDPDELAPAQRYVLRGGVETGLELRETVLPHGHDVFALDGALQVRTPDETIPVLPPIVEESVEPDGRTVLLVNDGIHRVFAAREAGLPISVVIARGVPAEYPYYALALENGWAGVAELDELPDGFQKKEYRRPDGYKALFRDFNALFPGVQKQRRRTNPAHLKA